MSPLNKYSSRVRSASKQKDVLLDVEGADTRRAGENESEDLFKGS